VINRGRSFPSIRVVGTFLAVPVTFLKVDCASNRSAEIVTTLVKFFPPKKRSLLASTRKLLWHPDQSVTTVLRPGYSRAVFGPTIAEFWGGRFGGGGGGGGIWGGCWGVWGGCCFFGGGGGVGGGGCFPRS